jgi:hypothetical protein
MPSSLVFQCPAPGVCPIRGDRKVTIIRPVQELRTFVVVEHAEGYVLIGMNLAHVKGKTLVQKVLTPIEDIHGDWLLRAPSLQAVEIKS